MSKRWHFELWIGKMTNVTLWHQTSHTYAVFPLRNQYSSSWKFVQHPWSNSGYCPWYQEWLIRVAIVTMTPNEKTGGTLYHLKMHFERQTGVILLPLSLEAWMQMNRQIGRVKKCQRKANKKEDERKQACGDWKNNLTRLIKLFHMHFTSLLAHR